MMESMIIENCPICGAPSKIVQDWKGNFFLCSDCAHAQNGPSCDDEETAIRYWNAMQRGLKMEVEK